MIMKQGTRHLTGIMEEVVDEDVEEVVEKVLAKASLLQHMVL